MEIESAEIAEGSVYFIAEAGINHNGDLDLAIDLIDAAAESGADAVKFQTFRPDGLVSPGHESYEMYEEYRLSRDDHRRLQSRAEERGLTFLSSPFDVEGADLLDDLGVPAIKIGSGEIVNHPLLEHVAGFDRPIIFSTGMATLTEVNEAREAIRSVDPDAELAILACTSSYPTPMYHANLRAVRTLEDRYPEVIGYSDHTTVVETPGLAVAAGARIVEKHFTVDRSLPGPDQETALEPDELERSVAFARTAATARGDGEIEPTIDADNRTPFRKSLHTTTALEAGETVTRESIAVIRPATGLAPKRLEDVVGATVTTDVDAYEPLEKAHLDL